MEKKIILLLSLLILSVVFVILFFKGGKISEVISKEEKAKKPKVYEVYYRIIILNHTITGETKCMSGDSIYDLLRYNLQVDLSKSLGKKVRFIFDTINNKLICFNDLCGSWEIKLNNRMVLLKDSCEGGTLELRFLE